MQAGGLGAVAQAVDGFGGFAEQIEKVSARHRNFWMLLYGQFVRARRKEASCSPAPTQVPGSPVAAAGRSMPTRVSSRCASVICSGVSASRVTGLPHGIGQVLADRGRVPLGL